MIPIPLLTQTLQMRIMMTQERRYRQKIQVKQTMLTILRKWSQMMKIVINTMMTACCKTLLSLQVSLQYSSASLSGAASEGETR